MTSATLRRLERVLLMVPWLLEHPGATVTELAERFGGTPEEVLRDLDTLGYCGLPGYGGGDLVEVTVFGDRVTVRMADFFARPLALSVKEAVTLLLAARALAGVEALPESGPLARAADKLERLLGADAAAGLAVELEASGAEHLPAVREALDRGRVVHLAYRSESKAELTEREVEPWTLTANAGAWYLQGWCRLADGPRDFRLDRVRSLQVLAEPASRAEHAPAPPVYRAKPGDPEVTLALAPQARWVAEWLVTDEVRERDTHLEVVFRAATLDWAARLVVSLAGQARVVGPAELARRVAQLARATRALHAP